MNAHEVDGDSKEGDEMRNCKLFPWNFLKNSSLPNWHEIGGKCSFFLLRLQKLNNILNIRKIFLLRKIE